ncbi:solute symporter family protein [Yinghuangia soli]|uniref:Cation acetate symporter n=1 Tax=Yinghuangia soli TaxID=2908204 RepID=A0AA41PWD2_9ACTN|nr:cation acetate symporter [Yinghuangia soli]MCF2526401.1 cation acetate symporter [Yinghuangia soli]
MLTIGLFLVFVAITLVITIWASRHSRTANDFYAGGREFSAAQNGLAISGDYMSAASFLGIAGLISLVGYDGFLYSIGFLVAWLVVLMLVAELVRNCGRYTMADVLAFRMSQRPVRTAAGASSIVVSIFYLLAQMVGAGSLVALLLGDADGSAQTLTIIAVGMLMIVYVTFGGMKGTTWIQIVKAALLMAGAVTLTVLVLVRFDGNVNAILHTAAQTSGHGEAFLQPGLQYGSSLTSRIDFISLALALVLGTAGLPHILVRFYTVPTARAARRSVMWAIGLIGAFYLMTIVLGFGAAAVLGSDEIRASNKAGNTALPLLAQELGGGGDSLGGVVLLAVIAAVAFATILAVVAGLTLASSASAAHDLYAAVIHKGRASEKEELAAARLSAIVIGAVAIALSLTAQKLNVAFLVALAFAVAASANLPTILFTLFWRRFNTRGTVWAINGGLISSVVLVIFSPVVSGGPNPLVTGVDFHWFPLANPGIVSIPIGFLAGWVGTLRSKEDADDLKYAEMEVRALTGAGAY